MEIIHETATLAQPIPSNFLRILEKSSTEPFLSNCPIADSKKKRGIPTRNKKRKKGIRNAPPL